MNSLPLISHHLFVAAVANETRRQERPMRRDRPNAELADQATAVPLEVVEARQSLPEGTSRALRARITQVEPEFDSPR